MHRWAGSRFSHFLWGTCLQSVTCGEGGLSWGPLGLRFVWARRRQDPRLSLAPVPCGFPTVIPPTKVNTEQASFACTLSTRGSAPHRGDKRPPGAAGSGQDGAHRSPEMAAPRLCVCRTSCGSGLSLARAQSRLSRGTTAPALFRGHSDGKPGLVGRVWGVRMPLFSPLPGVCAEAAGSSHGHPRS